MPHRAILASLHTSKNGEESPRNTLRVRTLAICPLREHKAPY